MSQTTLGASSGAGSSIVTISGNSGTASGTTVYIVGTGNITTTGDNMDILTISDSGSYVTSVSGTANRITSTGGTTPVIDISASYVGQNSITTLGTVTTGTWSASTITETKGGTNQTTYASGDILYASASNVLSRLAKGTDTHVLTLSAGFPSWAAPTGGGVTSVSGTASRITSTGGATPVIDIDASYVGQASLTTLGTITTGTWNGTVVGLAYGGTNANLTASNGGIFYSTATAGAILSGTATANKVLMSGSSTTPSWSTPTFPNASATSGKMIKSDGTNWTASTETYAAPSTSGNIMTSDGTNWTSATPAVTFLVATKTLTSSEIKNLHGTPIVVIAAPGAGKMINVISAYAKMNYGGTNVFVAGASQIIGLRMDTGITLGITLLANAQIVASSNQTQYSSPNSTTGGVSTSYENTSLKAYVVVATEISGNAANDNTIDIKVIYNIINV